MATLSLANPFDFEGQVVLMTGASGGLGAPIARAFAAGGARLALADVAAESAEELARQVRDEGASALTMRVDVRDSDQVDRMVERTLAEYSRIDVLVNLAGAIYRIPSLEHPLDKWKLQMDVNVMGTWLCCRAVGRVMVDQGRGRIVNFASGAGFHGFPGYPAYTPSKHAVVGLTKVLAIEWSGKGVNVNAIAPGFTDTPFNQDVLDDPAKLDGVLRRVPMGQVLPPDCTVGPTLFLASPASRWITGFTIRVDGGFNAT